MTILDGKFEGQFDGGVAYIYELPAIWGQCVLQPYRIGRQQRKRKVSN